MYGEWSEWDADNSTYEVLSCYMERHPDVDIPDDIYDDVFNNIRDYVDLVVDIIDYLTEGPSEKISEEDFNDWIDSIIYEEIEFANDAFNEQCGKDFESLMKNGCMEDGYLVWKDISIDENTLYWTKVEEDGDYTQERYFKCDMYCDVIYEYEPWNKVNYTGGCWKRVGSYDFGSYKDKELVFRKLSRYKNFW